MTAMDQALNQAIILKAALALATTGLPGVGGVKLFPVPPNTKKSYKSAAHSGGNKWGMTCDPDEIRADWARWPDANVGIPTGKVNRIWVMETDTVAGGHAHDGEVSLAALVAQHGPLPETLMARSPSGSIHYYWLWPTDDGGFEIKNTAGKIAPGIDTRGEGGMVVAPPSLRKGERYVWVNWGTPIARAPDWLVALARAATRRATESSSTRRDDGAAHCDVERLEAALRELPNPLDDVADEIKSEMDLRGGWENWNKVVMAIYAGDRSSVGKKLAHDWSRKNEAKYDEEDTDEKWKKLGESPPTDIGPSWIFKLVWRINPNWDRISRDDFYAHLPSGKFLFEPTLEYWPGESIDGFLPPVQITYTDADGSTKVKKIKPTAWLKRERPLQQTTWLPGKPKSIEHKILTREGVWVDRRGAKSYNLYRAPTLIRGDARLAGPWLDVVDRVAGDNRPHVLSWFAHRVQRPQEKINHALVFGGIPGIGKDSMIEPLARAVGPHNCTEADPTMMLDKNNRWLQAVVLRISEASDLGDSNRYKFHNHLKRYAAAPPHILLVQDKYIPLYPIANVVGVIITTNHRDGLYIPADDRRYHVTWSDARVEEDDIAFFDQYWSWLNSGGDGHVAAYLRDYDISKFNPAAPPPKTEAFWAMVEAGMFPEALEIENVIEVQMRSPDAFNIPQFFNAIPLDNDLREWFQDAKNKKLITRRFEDAGYVHVRNPDEKQGRWRIGRARATIYAKASLTPAERVRAARKFKAVAEATIQSADEEGRTAR
jgi:hypothetical protein